MKNALAFLLPFLVLASAQALTVEEYLQQVKSRHKGIAALEKSKEASEFRREAGDLELATSLSLTAKKQDDKKPSYLGTFVTDRVQSTEYSLGLGKKFSTGTNAQVTASTAETSVDARNLSPASSISQTNGAGSLGISLSQSLWKNGFGRATRLRQERESIVEAREKQAYDLQETQILIQAENAFWDLLYLRDEIDQRRDSLARAKRIESWVKRRVENGIGDNADLYSAQGLVASRELQLLTAQDDLTAAERRVRDILELESNQPLPSLQGDLSAKRGLDKSLTARTSGKIVRLDSYLTVLDAKTRAVAARETEDSFRPDLVLEGSYKTNASEADMAAANKRISNTETPTSSVALKFVWLLDGDLKDAARGTARSEALAAALRQERELLDGASSWAETRRRYEELTKKIEAAAHLGGLQTKKAAAFRDKLAKGRTITSDVITAEQDASEANLTLSKLRAEQRKMEASSRLFVSVGE